MHTLKILSIFVLAAGLFSQPALASKRVALLIGNADYRHSKTLKTPRNDVNDLAEVLRKRDFEVLVGLDLDRGAMQDIIDTFSRKLGAAEIGLFYYAGHGLQIDDQNYLVPTDAKLLIADYVALETVQLDTVEAALSNARKARIIVLDAARHNPLIALSRYRKRGTSQISKGLAAPNLKPGTLVALSTQPAELIYDTSGSRNSKFTSALIKRMNTDRSEIVSLFNAVANDVKSSSFGQQAPWVKSRLDGSVYLRKIDPLRREPIEDKSKPKPATTTSNRTYATQAEMAVWSTVKDSNDPNLIRVYLEQYPNGLFERVARSMLASLEKNDNTQTARSSQPDRPVNIPNVLYAPDRSSGSNIEPAETKPEQKEKVEEKVLSAAEKVEHTMTIQKELKRLGCYNGAIDGDWGRLTAGAIEEVAKDTGKDLDAEGPKVRTVSLLQGIEKPVCETKPVITNTRRQNSRTRSARRKYSERQRARRNRGSRRYKSSQARQNRAPKQEKMDWQKFWQEQSDRGRH